MYLCGPSVDSVITSVGTSGSSGAFGSIRLVSCGMSISSISTTCGGGALALIYPLLGDQYFLTAPYLAFPYLLLLVQHLLL